MAMAGAHDNRVTVTLGGREYELAATLLAERIYGDRFRDDLDELGRSGAYATQRVTRTVPATDGDGNQLRGEDGEPITEEREFVERNELRYSGRLKADVAVSSVASPYMGDVPLQVFAAAWAMGRAAGSIDLSWDEWIAALPSFGDEHIALWEAVCVDLAERAFFRHEGGPADAGEPDDGDR